MIVRFYEAPVTKDFVAVLELARSEIGVYLLARCPKNIFTEPVYLSNATSPWIYQVSGNLDYDLDLECDISEQITQASVESHVLWNVIHGRLYLGGPHSERYHLKYKPEDTPKSWRTRSSVIYYEIKPLNKIAGKTGVSGKELFDVMSWVDRHYARGLEK